MNTIASYYNDMYSVSGKNSGTELQESLKNTDYSVATEEELYDACKQFESYFVEQLIKQMEKMVPKSDEDSTVSKYMDYFGDTFTQEIAADISESNDGKGLGIAQMLYEQMKRNYGLD